MPDIFDEVEEDLRAERMQAFLRRYGVALAVLVLLLLGAVAGWQGWRWYQARRDATVAALYLSAMQQADALGQDAPAEKRNATADAFLKATAQAPAGYRTLGRLRAAALRADAGDQAQALALWNEVAADSAADPLLRDLAQLLWVQHQIDKGDPAALEAHLKPLEVADNPWHAMAEETQAMLDLRQGKTDAARTVLKKLASDVTAPPGVRVRAAGFLARLGA